MKKYLIAALVAAFSFLAFGGSTCPGKFLNDNPPPVKYDQEICFTQFSVLYGDKLKDPVTIPAATTSAIGGVKKMAAQADSTATDVAGLVADFNALLAKARTAGLM